MIPAGLPDAWTAYLAADGFIPELLTELGDSFATFGRLALAPGAPRPAAWAQNTWFDPALIRIASIGDGAKALRRIQRNWALYAFHLHRRAALIEAKLPPMKTRRIHFMAPPPAAPLGSWTLLDSGTIIAAAHCSSPFRHGELAFVEDKASPPNRAYLKLWEVFTLLQMRPEPGARCLDLGASPGGWTWVLQRCRARVIAVDKAPLAPSVARLPNLEYRRASAFAIDPASVGPVDWLFCDVVCYPTRLLKLVQRWLGTGLARRFVCTLKFQGETDHATARAFAAIPGSRLIHLSHNKHELTWIRL